MRIRGGSCYRRSPNPLETHYPRGTRFGDFSLERRLGDGRLYEATCTKCKARTAFSFASLSGELRCACANRIESSSNYGGNQQ